MVIVGTGRCSQPSFLRSRSVAGCDLLDQPLKPLKAKAISDTGLSYCKQFLFGGLSLFDRVIFSLKMPLVKDTELELLVPMEKVGNPRRSMSSLQDVPVFTDAAWQEVQSAFWVSALCACTRKPTCRQPRRFCSRQGAFHH